MTPPTSYIATVMLTPAPWPPLAPTALLDGTFSGSLVRLSGLPSGQVVLSAQSEGGPVRVVVFQRMSIRACGWALVEIGWQDALFITINGVDLVPDPSGTLSVAEVSGGNYAPPVARFSGIDCAAITDPTNLFFVQTVIDLEVKALSKSRYELIRGGGLLRQLLLDRLVHRVNQKFKRRVRFQVLDNSTPMPIPTWAEWRSIDPTLFVKIATQDVDLDGFLALPLLDAGDAVVRVRDVIDVCANAKGGVHLGNPRGESEGIVIDWDGVLVLAGREVSLHAVEGICNVTLRALEELVRDAAGLAQPRPEAVPKGSGS